MKTVVLCGMTLLAVAPGLARTSFEQSADQPNKTVTMTGCVGGGSDSKPITLSQALIIPGTPQPGQIDQTPSPLPPAPRQPSRPHRLLRRRTQLQPSRPSRSGRQG